MALAYAREKSRRPVRVFATHPDNIKEQLGDALVSHVGSIDLEQDVPGGLREEHREPWERVASGTPISGGGTPHASVREMSSEEAVEAAKLIY